MFSVEQRSTVSANFIMQYVLHCKLAENNNELPLKPFQRFLSKGAVGGKIVAVTEY